MTSDISSTIRKVVKKEIKRKKKRAAVLYKDNFKNTEFSKQIQGKPFWIEDAIQHELQRVDTNNNCCFWHIIGLPEKEHLIGRDEKGQEMLEKRFHGMFDYEIELHGKISNNRYVRVKKATGLGITSFVLRLIAYLCVKDNKYNEQEMVIVTGPRQQLADELLDRLYNLFANTDYRPRRAENNIWINSCKITAYPSHNFDSARGQDKCRLFFVDEADFFPQSQIETAMAVLERYEAKTHPHVILVSTVNLPGGLFDQMDKGRCPQFVTLELFYEKGIGKIYTEYEIEQAKKMISFQREYNGKYGLGEGNIFPYQLVEKCIERYSFEPSDGIKYLSIDPAFGSSKFAILAFEVIGDEVYIDAADEFDRPSFSAMIERIVVMSKTHPNIIMDDSDPGLRRELCGHNLQVYTANFKTELQEMTMLAAKYIKEKRVKIHPCFEELIHQLISVRSNDKGHPDKTLLKFDLGDAFLMAIKVAARISSYLKHY